MILQTDSDYLTYDGGEYAKLYPKAEVYTFHGTGHLTFQYQFEEMKNVIGKFIIGMKE